MFKRNDQWGQRKLFRAEERLHERKAYAMRLGSWFFILCTAFVLLRLEANVALYCSLCVSEARSIADLLCSGFSAGGWSSLGRGNNGLYDESSSVRIVVTFLDWSRY